MRLMLSVLCLAVCLFVSGFAFAGSCPSGAGDCFLCGGKDGIPCSTNCTGKYVKGVGNVACQCPQGKACECYCPYMNEVMQQIDDECAVDPACAQKYLPTVNGVMGYITKIEGNVVLRKAGTDIEVPVTPLTVLNENDRLIIPEGAHAFIVFPGNNIRGFFGEVDMTVRREAEANEAKLETVGDFVALLYAIKEQIVHNADGEPAGTVTGTGRLLFDQGRHSELGEVGYSMESEVLLEGNDSSQTLKVIEGKVTARNEEGKAVTVRTGEQFTAAPGRFSSGDVKPFDYSKEDLSWADGYKSISCDAGCQSGQVQTPFPGCSCIEESGGTGCGSGFILAFVLGAVMLVKRI
jgi:hypothetical protein